jgi:hypothetical protein
MKTDNRILISIPVYRNDTPSYVEKSISSIVCQLKENDKLIIQVDGFINDDLNKSILKYLDYKNISIFLSVENILNKKFYDIPNVPVPGVTFMSGIKFKI